MGEIKLVNEMLWCGSCGAGEELQELKRKKERRREGRFFYAFRAIKPDFYFQPEKRHFSLLCVFGKIA